MTGLDCPAQRGGRVRDRGRHQGSDLQVKNLRPLHIYMGFGLTILIEDWLCQCSTDKYIFMQNELAEQ